MTLSGINLALTQGNEYGVVVDAGGYAQENAAFNTNQTSYSGGNLWLLDQNATVWQNRTGLNLYFQETLVSGQTSTTPEPGAWVLMGAGLGALVLLRRLG